MSRRRDIENHRRSLDEIRNIMNAMKNMSYVETRKISAYVDVQNKVVSSIEEVAKDFLGFYPQILNGEDNPSAQVIVLIGAERGFCGDFNHALLRHFESRQTKSNDKAPSLIVVGHKLHMLLQDLPGVTAFIEGASVAEDVARVLSQLVNELVAIQLDHHTISLSVIYFDDEQRLMDRQLLPPFQDFLHTAEPQNPYPAVLNLPPEQFLLELGDHYLFALLNEILYVSLLAENHRRLAHLEGAVSHMDEKTEQLRHRINVLRQEEIIEEIEVILLNAGGVDELSLI